MVEVTKATRTETREVEVETFTVTLTREEAARVAAGWKVPEIADGLRSALSPEQPKAPEPVDTWTVIVEDIRTFERLAAATAAIRNLDAVTGVTVAGFGFGTATFAVTTHRHRTPYASIALRMALGEQFHCTEYQGFVRRYAVNKDV